MTQEIPAPDAFVLKPAGFVPNNPTLPVLAYRGAFDDPGALHQRLAANAWPVQWEGGIFDYHHYHSTAHEALTCIAGRARVILGGPGGREVELRAGDLMVLPAGTGHCLAWADAAFRVLGAYPAGQDWDMCREAADDATLRRIAEVPVPHSDPLGGREGPLPRLWG